MLLLSSSSVPSIAEAEMRPAATIAARLASASFFFFSWALESHLPSAFSLSSSSFLTRFFSSAIALTRAASASSSAFFFDSASSASFSSFWRSSSSSRCSCCLARMAALAASEIPPPLPFFPFLALPPLPGAACAGELSSRAALTPYDSSPPPAAAASRSFFSFSFNFLT